MWYVYILKCEDGKHYTGCTQDLDKRIEKHNAGSVKFTSSRLPIELISYFAFKNKYTAYKFEKYLKSGSGIAFANKRLR